MKDKLSERKQIDNIDWGSSENNDGQNLDRFRDCGRRNAIDLLQSDVSPGPKSPHKRNKLKNAYSVDEGGKCAIEQNYLKGNIAEISSNNVCDFNGNKSAGTGLACVVCQMPFSQTTPPSRTCESCNSALLDAEFDDLDDEFTY
jgi:hypothetical protein